MKITLLALLGILALQGLAYGAGASEPVRDISANYDETGQFAVISLPNMTVFMDASSGEIVMETPVSDRQAASEQFSKFIDTIRQPDLMQENTAKLNDILDALPQYSISGMPNGFSPVDFRSRTAKSAEACMAAAKSSEEVATLMDISNRTDANDHSSDIFIEQFLLSRGIPAQDLEQGVAKFRANARAAQTAEDNRRAERFRKLSQIDETGGEIVRSDAPSGTSSADLFVFPSSNTDSGTASVGQSGEDGGSTVTKGQTGPVLEFDLGDAVPPNDTTLYEIPDLGCVGPNCN